MKYIRVRPLEDMYGFHLDPREYLRVLPGIVPELPAGAAEFASDPGHYDFGSPRCVKDLTLRQVEVRDDLGRVSIDVSLAPNEWKHESGLRIRYTDVHAFWMSCEESEREQVCGFGEATGATAFAERVGELPSLGDLQLDEILPSSGGFSHEIAFTEGALRVEGHDLVARWDRPPPAGTAGETSG